jgi:hypothetical protein
MHVDSYAPTIASQLSSIHSSFELNSDSHHHNMTTTRPTFTGIVPDKGSVEEAALNAILVQRRHVLLHGSGGTGSREHGDTITSILFSWTDLNVICVRFVFR